MPWGVAAAAVVGAYSANKQSKAAKDAANAQGQSADKAAQVQWDMFNQARTDNEPFRQAGLTGLNEYMALLGLPTSGVQSATTASRVPNEWFGAGDAPSVNSQLYASDPAYRRAWDEVDANHRRVFKSGYTNQSDRNAIQGDLSRLWAQYTPAAASAGAGTPGTSLTQADAFARFRNTPGYKFGLDQGVKALDSSAAAAGGLFSGKAAKALTQFGQNYADQQGYRPHMNSLASLAGIGQTATGQNNQIGMQTAGNVGNAYQNAGAARASGIAGSANAWGDYASGLGGLAGAYAGGMFSGGGGSSSPGWWGRGGWGGI